MLKHRLKLFGFFLLFSVWSCSGAGPGGEGSPNDAVGDGIGAPNAMTGPTQTEGNIGPGWDPNPKSGLKATPLPTPEGEAYLHHNSVVPADDPIDHHDGAPPSADGDFKIPQKL